MKAERELGSIRRESVWFLSADTVSIMKVN